MTEKGKAKKKKEKKGQKARKHPGITLTQVNPVRKPEPDVSQPSFTSHPH